MNLWSQVFGDSKDYVQLMIDAYYNEENIETYLNKKGEIISALWSIPYKFKCDEFENYIKGLYLCGLATQPSYRGKGYISTLMDRIEDKARSLGYEFCFLIPADDNLRKFYEKRGYVSMPGKLNLIFECDNSIGIKDLIKDVIKIDGFESYLKLKGEGEIFQFIGENTLAYSVKELYISDDEFEKFIEVYPSCAVSDFEFNLYQTDLGIDKIWCKDNIKYQLLRNSYLLFNDGEKSLTPYSILHSWRDFIITIRENNISGGKVVVLNNNEDIPKFILFCYYVAERRTVDVRFCTADSIGSFNLMLLYLKFSFPGCNEIKFSNRSILSSKVSPMNSHIFFRKSDGESVLTWKIKKDTPEFLNYGMIKRLYGPSEIKFTNEYPGGEKINSSERVEGIDKFYKLNNKDSIVFNKDTKNAVNKELCYVNRGDANILNETKKYPKSCKCNSEADKRLNISLLLD